jgi:hypothetical protein
VTKLASKILKIKEDTIYHKVGLNNTHFHIRADNDDQGNTYWEVSIWKTLPNGTDQEYIKKPFYSEKDAREFLSRNYDKYE